MIGDNESKVFETDLFVGKHVSVVKGSYYFREAN